jgi:hypothetical protein
MRESAPIRCHLTGLPCNNVLVCEGCLTETPACGLKASYDGTIRVCRGCLPEAASIMDATWVPIKSEIFPVLSLRTLTPVDKAG